MNDLRQEAKAYRVKLKQDLDVPLREQTLMFVGILVFISSIFVLGYMLGKLLQA